VPALTGPDRVIARRYRLLSVLGRGGMGTVWRAYDDVLDRLVAIKEVSPPPDVTSDEGQMLRERTLREARTAARLNHPNVVTIYDVVEDGEKPWIVMELVESRSLRDIVERDGPLPPTRVAAIGLQLLAALRAAHGLGIVHRDVKPGNVLIDADGRAVLGDFGIARAVGSPSLTRSGVLVGSPSYIAPERASGQRGGPASDLWSLGATLYTAVEGRPPYERDGAWATLNAVITQDPDPPERAGPLWPALSELLRRDPDRRLRPQAAEQMLRQVAEIPDPEGTVPMSGTAAGAVAGAAGGLAAAEKTRAFHGQPALAGPPSGLPERGTPARTGPAPGLLPGSGPPGYRPSITPPIQPHGGRPGQARPARRGFWLGALAAVAALMIGGAALVVSHTGRPQGSPASPGGRGTTAQASPTGKGSHSPNPNGHTPPGQQGQGGGPGGGAAALPPGYHGYRDATGFSIGVPADWSVSHQGPYVYITPPSGGMFLLIAQTDHPKQDPLADWRQQEAARRGTYSDYHLIRLAAVNYAEAERAADWEFTYTGSGGPTHVLNRNVLANPHHAYALYWSTPTSTWTADYHYFEAFAATFRPAGGVGADGS
jgi:eukaryotic-like serine/threonine-protein kinase